MTQHYLRAIDEPAVTKLDPVTMTDTWTSQRARGSVRMRSTGLLGAGGMGVVNRALVLLVMLMVPMESHASPCASSTTLFDVVISAEPSPFVSGSVRLHFEGLYLGYAPVIGSAVAVLNGDSVTVTVPVTDTADFGARDAPPASAFCGTGDVEIGPLAAGPYGVQLLHQLTVAGTDRGLYASGGANFIWSENGTVACSSRRTFALVPSSPGPQSNVTLSSTRATAGEFYGTSVTITGKNINVSDGVTTEAPMIHVLFCLTTHASLGKLAPGTYKVAWQETDFGRPTQQGDGQYEFTVNAASVEVPALNPLALVWLAALLGIAGFWATGRNS
jgi:hypothetical protein